MHLQKLLASGVQPACNQHTWLCNGSLSAIPVSDGPSGRVSMGPIRVQHTSVLSRSSAAAAVRIMEVRKAYSADDFEWDMCKSMANDKLNAGNAKLMQTFALETFEKAATQSTEAPS